jgi:hypothetical protein
MSNNIKTLKTLTVPKGNDFKICIFCGEIPKEKTDEHVFPKWLINFTDSNDKVRQSLNLYTGEELFFSFNKFVFPACKTCNTSYGESLELQASKTLPKIMDGIPVTATETEAILDWFDKLRIGYWLGMRILQKNPMGVDPKYSIDTRIGSKDRILIIRTHPNTALNGIQTTGYTPLFSLMPSCLTFRFKNVFFTSISTDFLVSYNLGLNYPIFMVPEKRTSEMGIIEGTGKIEFPLINRTIVSPHILITQSVHKFLDPVTDSEVFEKSKIYTGINQEYHEFTNSEIITPESLQGFVNIKPIGIEILDFQNFLTSAYAPQFKKFPKSGRKTLPLLNGYREARCLNSMLKKNWKD